MDTTSHCVSAHPRSRGENGIGTRLIRGIRGSSPLTRGKPLLSWAGFSVLRLIPAHAGKTMSETMITVPSWAHPRSRGENAAGLPEPGAGHRLIPAHAGKTPTWSASSAWTRAHPRSRGQNIIEQADPISPLGSSPLTRGKRSGRARSRLAGRLIPAHAGKTHCSVLSVCRGAAHPRSRGENGARGGVRFGGGGSSPLTRGKLVGTRHVGPSTGLIPAHAGKTSYRRVGLRSFRAHPRSRGENAIARGARKRCGGSSPLTREKLKSAFGSVQSARLIPAHAGKTPFCSSVARAARAHPRSRGENALRGCQTLGT